MNKYKAIIFTMKNGIQAYELFYDWIKDKRVEIISFQYQQDRDGYHSIVILYTETE